MSIDQQPEAGTKPQIGISRIESIPAAVLDEFVRDVTSEGIELRVGTHGSVFAGIEWLIPTAIVVFISRAYFDAFLSEAGKDHYKALKRGIKKLYRRIAPLAISPRGTSGKLSGKQIYSLNFSILVRVVDHLTIKFLIQPEIMEADAEKALDAFLDLIESVSNQSIDPKIIRDLENGRVVGRTLLLAYDFKEERIVVVDPIPMAPLSE